MLCAGSSHCVHIHPIAYLAALVEMLGKIGAQLDAVDGKVDAVRSDVKALQEAGSEEQTVLSYTSVVGP